MNNKILNELKYTKDLIENGFKEKRYKKGISLVARYYYHIEGLRDKDLKEKVKEFCYTHIDDFNEVLFFRLINSFCSDAKKKDLFVLKPIDITKSELNTIQREDCFKKQKVLFTMLVQSKINRQYYIHNIRGKIKILVEENKSKKTSLTYEELRQKFPKIFFDHYCPDTTSTIFRLAKVSMKNDEKNTMLKSIIDDGLVELTRQDKFRINYINHKDTVALRIDADDLTDYILEYECYIGKINLKQCCECGRRIKAKSNGKKYCKDCLSKIRKSQIRESVKKHRQNKNSKHIDSCAES